MRRLIRARTPRDDCFTGFRSLPDWRAALWTASIASLVAARVPAPGSFGLFRGWIFWVVRFEYREIHWNESFE